MFFRLVSNMVLRSIRSPRVSMWGLSAIIVGLLVVSLGSVAAAEPAAQANATGTPSATATTTSAAACVSPPQGLVVIVAAPSPGDVLGPGANVVVQGIAYDAASTTGPGVDRVSVYLGDRDTGGTFWGDALLGQPNPQASTGPLASAGFSLRSPTIPTGSGRRTISVYAHSLLTNREAVAAVPVFLGAAPTPVKGQVPTAALPPPPVCTPAPTATLVPTVTPLPAAPVATTSAAAPAASTPPATPRPAVPAVPAAPIPAAPAPAAPAAAPAPVAPAAAASTGGATATTAPRGGGIPIEFGLLLLGLGAAVVGGGVIARRREPRGVNPHR